METNRIARYLNDSREAGVSITFWDNWIGDIKKEGTPVKGTVKLCVSDEGEYKLNIVLSPDR